MTGERDPRAGLLPSQDEISARFAAGDMQPAREPCPLCKVVVSGLIFDGRGELASVFLPAQSVHHAATCEHFRQRAIGSGAASVAAATPAELEELSAAALELSTLIANGLELDAVPALPLLRVAGEILAALRKHGWQLPSEASAARVAFGAHSDGLLRERAGLVEAGAVHFSVYSVPTSQACALGDHDHCPRETTLGTSKCECLCHKGAP